MAFLFNKNITDYLFAKLHLSVRFLLPIIVFLIIIFFKLPLLAYILILLSKWRIVARSPKTWWFNLRINAADLIVASSIIYFMSSVSVALVYKVAWLGFYLFWTLYIKSIKRQNGHVIQGITAQILGTTAVSYGLYQLDFSLSIILIWFIALFSAHHVINGFKENHQYYFQLVYAWSLFSIQLAWVLFHWPMNFWLIPRISFIQGLIAITILSLYILNQKSKISTWFNRHIITSVIIVIIGALLVSNFQSIIF